MCRKVGSGVSKTQARWVGLCFSSSWSTSRVNVYAAPFFSRGLAK